MVQSVKMEGSVQALRTEQNSSKEKRHRDEKWIDDISSQGTMKNGEE